MSANKEDRERRGELAIVLGESLKQALDAVRGEKTRQDAIREAVVEYVGRRGFNVLAEAAREPKKARVPVPVAVVQAVAPLEIEEAAKKIEEAVRPKTGPAWVREYLKRQKEGKA